MPLLLQSEVLLSVPEVTVKVVSSLIQREGLLLGDFSQLIRVAQRLKLSLLPLYWLPTDFDHVFSNCRLNLDQGLIQQGNTLG